MLARVFKLLLFFLSTQAFGSDLPLFSFMDTDWAALIDQADGVKVKFGIDLGAPASYRRNNDLLFIPASVTKILIADAALEFLGSSFRYKTEVQWKQTQDGKAYQLEVIGAGDPSWGLAEFGETVSTRFQTWARSLKARGIKTVIGQPQFLAKNQAWEDPRAPEGWDKGDEQECYGALAHAINLNLNCATFLISGLAAGTWREEGLEDLPMEFRLVSGEKTSLELVQKNIGNLAEGFLVRGTLKEGSIERVQVPIKIPSHWLRILFRRALQGEGIAILPSQGDPIEPLQPQKIFTFSPTLGELLKPFLKNSINLMGDSFLKSIGEHYSFRSSESFLEAGRMGLDSYFQYLQIPAEIHIYDGSGLSRKSLVSPTAMLFFMNHLSKSKNFPFIWDGLPIAGLDGTLSSRMKGTAAEGVLRGKTGTMSGIYNLAGFIPGKRNFVPFVMFTDSKSEFRSAARLAEDRVGVRLTEVISAIGWIRVSKKKLVAYPFFPEHSGEPE